MFEWGSFAGGLIGATAGAAVTWAVAWLSKRERDRAARHRAIKKIDAAFNRLAAELNVFDFPLPGYTQDMLLRAGKVQSCLIDLDVHLRKSDDAVADWVSAMAGQVLFAPSRVLVTRRAVSVGTRLSQWQTGRITTQWFKDALEAMEDKPISWRSQG